jgi:hypothetical protein
MWQVWQHQQRHHYQQHQQHQPRTCRYLSTPPSMRAQSMASFSRRMWAPLYVLMPSARMPLMMRAAMFSMVELKRREEAAACASSMQVRVLQQRGVGVGAGHGLCCAVLC